MNIRHYSSGIFSIVLCVGILFISGLSEKNKAGTGNLAGDNRISSGVLDESESMADERFERGMDHYQNAEYDSAAYYFSGIDTPEARLFSGKSYFALSEYPKAKNKLRQLTRDDDPRLRDEARYTLAMAEFQTRQYGKSLDNLYNLKSRPAYQNLHEDAGSLYDQIIGYLTTGQRHQAFLQSEYPRVQFDLLRYGLDHMDKSEASELYQTLENYFHETMDTNMVAALSRRIDRLPEERRQADRFGGVPEGIVYNIGILLPATESGSREWQIARSLYNGYLLAAEEFNREHNNKHVRLHHVATSDTALTNKAAIAKMAWNYHADAVIGPLFSDAAYEIRELAEYYQIPVIPPLANADTLNIGNPYLYQVNPTFESKGKAMARFAVNELELDTLAVITQSNKSVVQEARAFRNEAEKLGAEVVHYFSENFEEKAFQVEHITPWFARSEEYFGRNIEPEDFPLVPIKGLYLSVEGSGSEQLIDIILTDLQANRSEVTILGNEEMSRLELSDERRRYFDIYYSDFFHIDEDRRETHRFRDDFQSLTGFRPDNFAHLGYDVATFLFQSLEKLQNPGRIKSQLRHRPVFEGIITNIDFKGSHINQYLHFLNITRDEIILYVPEEEENGDENNNEN